MMTNAMKLSLMLALSTAGMIEAQSCAAPIQLSVRPRATVVLHSHEFTVRFFVFLLKTPPTYICKHVPLLAFF